MAHCPLLCPLPSTNTPNPYPTVPHTQTGFLSSVGQLSYSVAIGHLLLLYVFIHIACMRDHLVSVPLLLIDFTQHNNIQFYARIGTTHTFFFLIVYLVILLIFYSILYSILCVYTVSLFDHLVLNSLLVLG